MSHYVHVRLTDQQAAHVATLAKAADRDDADIIRGLIELDMKGPVDSATAKLTELCKQLTDYLNGVTDEKKPERMEKRKEGKKRLPGTGSVDLRPSGKWRARAARIGGSQETLGHFTYENEAHDACDRWAGI